MRLWLSRPALVSISTSFWVPLAALVPSSLIFRPLGLPTPCHHEPVALSNSLCLLALSLPIYKMGKQLGSGQDSRGSCRGEQAEAWLLKNQKFLPPELSICKLFIPSGSFLPLPRKCLLEL